MTTPTRPGTGRAAPGPAPTRARPGSGASAFLTASVGTCPACGRRVTPDADGTVRIVGLAPREAPRLWVWGPAVVHEECRYDVETPLDDRTGYLPVEQRVRYGG